MTWAPPSPPESGKILKAIDARDCYHLFIPLNGEATQRMSDKIFSPEEAQVWEVVQKFNQAFAENQVDAYFSYLDDEVIVITPSNPYRVEGKVQDHEGFVYDLEQGTAQVGYFQALQPRVRICGNAAVVTYYSRGAYGAQGRERTSYLKETDVLERRNGGWKIIHIHVSSTG
jgi:ketosteroid isomerase-like protein